MRQAIAVLAELGSDRRRPLPADLPLGHVERRWQRHVVVKGGIDRTYWDLATYFALTEALASGDIWVPTSRLHRSLDELLTPPAAMPNLPGRLPRVSTLTADEWLAGAAAELDAALLDAAHGLSGSGVEITGDRLRFPKVATSDVAEEDGARRLAERLYGAMPTTRITDVLSRVAAWTGFVGHFGHVSTGLPPDDERTFLAALIAEATNLGLSRMAEVCGVVRRWLARLGRWAALPARRPRHGAGRGERPLWARARSEDLHDHH